MLKKLRIKKDNKKRNDYKYVLKCRKCGEIKEVYTSTVYKSNIKCLKCDALSHIGEVYGTQEIIDFVGWEKDKHGNLNQRFYKVKCTNCGHIYDSKRYDNIK